MTYITGSTICIPGGIPIAAWVYGSTLCTTLPDEGDVHPPLAWIRVTSLVHSWVPGKYILAMGLGDLSGQFTLADWIKKLPGPVAPEPEPEPYVPPEPEDECSPEGRPRCFGADLYTCQNGRWVLTEPQSPSCVYEPEPPEPVPPVPPRDVCRYRGETYQVGQSVCMGRDLYTCTASGWLLVAPNSLLCGILPV